MLVDKKAIAAAFGRAAQSYSQYDELQKLSAQGLLKLLAEQNFATVLDAGCGPGNNSRFWRETGSSVIALDLSQPMLEQARICKAADMYLVADIEAIPIADAQFDLVWSHLAVQWCTSLSRALAELYRVARPGGRIAFTTLLSNSLPELIQAWKAVDAQLHTNNFLSTQEVENSLSNYWRVRYCEQLVTLYFNNPIDAMYSLKKIGANHLHSGRSPKIFTRCQLNKLKWAWPQYHGRYPLTYHLFHMVIERD